MDNWDVVETVVVLVGLLATVSAPIMKLVSCITKLTSTVKSLQENFDNVTSKNTESHRRLWEKNEEQDRMLAEHDGKIKNIEFKMDTYHER